MSEMVAANATVPVVVVKATSFVKNTLSSPRCGVAAPLLLLSASRRPLSWLDPGRSSSSFDPPYCLPLLPTTTGPQGCCKGAAEWGK